MEPHTVIPSLRGIRNLLIDFGGVLINLDKEHCMHNFRRLGIHGLEHLLQSCHQQGFLLELEKGELSTEAFCRHVRSLCLPEALPEGEEEVARRAVPDAASILRAWNSFLVGIPPYKLRQLLLLRRRYRTFLLSNTNEPHWAWSERHDFSRDGHTTADYFDGIYLSCRLHTAKPGAEYFEQVIRQSGIRPEESLFIDDSEANCATARTFGIRTYTPAARTDWAQQLFPDLDQF